MKKIIILSTLFLLILTGCKNQPAKKAENTQITNPASTHCEEKGGTIELRDLTGWCLFPDGSECEEWAFYRGECLPQTVQSLEQGQLKKCITGYDYFGKNQFELTPADQGCPPVEELNNFCGKNTYQVSKCDSLIKLISANPDAGNMFFQDSKVLSCPHIDSINMSQACQNALNTPCQTTINCN